MKEEDLNHMVRRDNDELQGPFQTTTGTRVLEGDGRWR